MVTHRVDWGAGGRAFNPNVIYAGTGESDIRADLSSGDGVYKSPDGGATWKNVGLRDSRQISRIVVDPERGHRLRGSAGPRLWP